MVTYFGSQQVGQISPALYYLVIVVGLVISLFIWWAVQKRMTGLSGTAVTTIQHGIDPRGLESYVGKLDKYLDEKLKLHGYELQNYRTEEGEFVRAVRFRGEVDDLVTMRVKPYVLTVEAEMNSDSIQAAKTAVTYINSLNVSAPGVSTVS